MLTWVENQLLKVYRCFQNPKLLKKPEIKLVTVDVICIFILLEDPSLISPRSRNSGAKQTTPKYADWSFHVCFFKICGLIPPGISNLLLSKFRARKPFDIRAKLRSLFLSYYLKVRLHLIIKK